MRHFDLAQLDDPDLVGLSDVLDMVRRGWRTVLGAAVAGLALALVWLQWGTVPDWRAEAAVMLAPDLPTEGGTAGTALSTELERLRGSAMTRAVVARLGFDRDPGFADGGRPALTRWLGDGLSDAPLADRAAERLRSRTAIQLVPGSAVARITASSDSPAQAAAIAQGYAEEYLSARETAIAAAETAAEAELARRAAEVDRARSALADIAAGDPGTAGLASVTRDLRASRSRLDQARTAARRASTSASAAAARQLALTQASRSHQQLQDAASALSAELDEQDRLATRLADATAAHDRAREAWLRQRAATLRPAILSAARPPLVPGAPNRAVVLAAGTVAGLLAGLALLLAGQHQRSLPQRAARTLGLRLLAGPVDPAGDRDAALQLLATLQDGPMDLALVPAGSRRGREAAARLAAELAAALASRGDPVRLLLCGDDPASGDLLRPAVFGAVRPHVTRAGSAMVERMLAGPAPRPRTPPDHGSTITLTPPLEDWHGRALARRADRAVLILDRRDAWRAGTLRDLLRQAPLRPAGVIVTTGRRG